MLVYINDEVKTMIKAKCELKELEETIKQVRPKAGKKEINNEACCLYYSIIVDCKGKTSQNDECEALIRQRLRTAMYSYECIANLNIGDRLCLMNGLDFAARACEQNKALVTMNEYERDKSLIKKFNQGLAPNEYNDKELVFVCMGLVLGANVMTKAMEKVLK